MEHILSPRSIWEQLEQSKEPHLMSPLRWSQVNEREDTELCVQKLGDKELPRDRALLATMLPH